MLIQAEMFVVITLTEKITLGMQECMTAEAHLLRVVKFLKVPQRRAQTKE